MANHKFPKEYTEGDLGLIKDPFKPEFRFDSKGRLIMPLPGYSKMMLSVEPGSKKIGQGTEDEAGQPQTDPGSLKTGYLHAKTAVLVGPEGGWVVQLAGGDAEHPISYFNEATKVSNFWVDRQGNVYFAGKVVAGAGSEVDWSYVKNISVLNIHIGEVLTVVNTEADITEDNPQLYAWITGAKPPVDADHTADIVSAMAYEDLVELSKLGTTIVQGGYLKTILIDAQYIQAGIMTGRTVRTKSSGARVVMGGGADWIKFYDASAEQAVLYGYGGSFLIKGSQSNSNIFIQAGSGGVVSLFEGTTLKLLTTAAGITIPEGLLVEASIDLEGNLDFDAANRYIRRGTDIHLKLTAANLECHRHFTPNSPGVKNLGSAGDYWDEVHYVSLHPHSPKVFSGKIGFEILDSIKTKNGKLDTIDVDKRIKVNGRLELTHLVMANIAAIKELENRLKKVE